jgi:hypothetical protein
MTIDLNTLISTALTNAIEQATLPLQRVINAQEENILQLSERIAALEQARAPATPATPAEPTAPTEKTILNDIYMLMAYIEQAVEQGISTHCEEAEHNEECDIDSWIERDVERHESNQHDDDDSFEEKVRKALRSLVRSL